MSKQDIRDAYNAGNSNWEVLHMAVASGLEFPDAVFRVSQALRLDAEGIEEMVANYDDLA